MTRAAPVVLATLALATIAAIVWSQKLKGSPPLIVRPHIEGRLVPASERPSEREATISFWLLNDDDVSVSIIDANGNVVRHLARSLPLRARIRERWAWRGRDDAGVLVPDGRYRVRVELLQQGRTVDIPDAAIAVNGSRR